MRKLYTVIAFLMIACMVLGACTPKTPVVTTEEPVVEQPTEEVVVTEEPEATEAEPEEVVYAEQPFGENLPTAPTITTPLVVAYEAFSQKFSPFFADTGYDQDVSAMTQISLLTTDRLGGIIYNAIEGETVNYNGTDYLYKGPADTSVEYDEATDTTKYTAKLRVGMTFSDGTPVTADDVIFTYYTYLDPSYVGSTSLASYDIVGLKDYQTQTTSEVFDKYAAVADAILAAGVDHEWSDADAWTQEQQDDFWARYEEAWKTDVQKIVNYVNGKYLDGYAVDVMGMEPAEISANEGLQVAFGMAMWGFGEKTEEGLFVAAVSGNTWDLVESFPTLEDYYNETYAAYEGDLAAYAGVESPDGTDCLGNVNSQFIGFWGPQDESMGGEGVPNIAGIKKIDDYTVEVTLNGYSAPAVYSILGINVTPLHYYGDVAKYDYENNMFGFEFGELSKQQSLTATPMGAGANKFVKNHNKVFYFAAN